MNVHGFEEEDITILMDDGEHIEPTRENIIAAYEQVVADSEDGDAIFLHYSGKSYRWEGAFYRKVSWFFGL